ncbi:hypothetical protein TB2_045419 [Malus domestica]
MGFKVVEINNAETGSGALFEIKLMSLLVLIVTKLTLTLVVIGVKLMILTPLEWCIRWLIHTLTLVCFVVVAWCIQFLYSLSRLVHVFQLDKENVDGSNPFILAGRAAPLLAESPSSPAHTLEKKS